MELLRCNHNAHLNIVK